DGYLYIATGDGGSGGDPCGSGQREESFLGKILRIDVDSESEGKNYGIPADNPFVGEDDILPEIWSLGLRNPWRFSFDPANGDMYIADVGQGAREEVSYQRGTSRGGENYEWKIREGSRSFQDGTYGAGARQGPIYEYSHSSGALRGCSITGGVVYRGCRMPDLQGTYFFADYCSDWVATFRVEDGVATTPVNITAALNEGIAPDEVDDISAFGVDGRGEVYICDLGTKLFRIVPSEV
ncbi:MAG: PQQ-dependent sugar dehydrogenase, partial [Planctomycetota bacterium]